MQAGKGRRSITLCAKKQHEPFARKKEETIRERSQTEKMRVILSLAPWNRRRRPSKVLNQAVSCLAPSTCLFPFPAFSMSRVFSRLGDKTVVSKAALPHSRLLLCSQASRLLSASSPVSRTADRASSQKLRPGPCVWKRGRAVGVWYI